MAPCVCATIIIRFGYRAIKVPKFDESEWGTYDVIEWRRGASVLKGVEWHGNGLFAL